MLGTQCSGYVRNEENRSKSSLTIRKKTFEISGKHNQERKENLTNSPLGKAREVEGHSEVFCEWGQNKNKDGWVRSKERQKGGVVKGPRTLDEYGMQKMINGILTLWLT